MLVFPIENIKAQVTTGNKNVVRQNRKITNFEGIDVGGAFDVYISEGDSYKVTVESDENLLDKIRTEVDGDVLRISTKGRIRRATKLNVYIRIKELRYLHTGGASDVYAETDFNTPSLEIRSSGASDVKMGAVYSKYISCNISGATDVRMSGKTSRLDVSVSGSGDFKAYDLVAEEGEVKVSGSGDANVHFTRSIRASVSGAGDVRCMGNPRNRDIQISGAGDIHWQ